jgi:predicted phage terminase large subunit-like protein
MKMQQILQKPLSLTEAERLINNPAIRQQMRKPFLGFCLIHLPHYLRLPPADFHPEMLSLLEDFKIKFLSIIGFRGSAKSSYASVALPLWMALERPEDYPFIILINETRDQVIENIANIRKELEANELLRLDYGDLSEGISKQREWTKTGLLLKNGVRILGLSRGQRIRGRRHREHRPSVVIVDDPEEITKVEKIEYRNKTEKWLRGEVIPAIEEVNARLLVLGNILNTDAIMARLKNDPIFVHKDYALFKGEPVWTNCTWKGKYPTAEALKAQELKVRHTAWMREYLLKVIPPEGQVIKEEWIQYYDAVPAPVYETHPKTKQQVLVSNPILSAGVGVDLAISKKESADYTTMVGGVMALEEARAHIFILPNPVNARLNFQETIAYAKGQYNMIKNQYAIPMFFVEDVAYQRVAIEMMQAAGIPADPVKVGTDKRARLLLAAPFIENGTVKFPRKGCEDLIAQLTGFGIEDHDDLVDAFVHFVLGVNNQTGMQPLEVIRIL